MKLYQVAANTPFNNSLLTYSSELELALGDCVEVPLGKRKTIGWVIGKVGDDQLEKDKIKSILDKHDATLALSQHELELYQWMASYYHYPLGQLIADCLPKAMKRPRDKNIPPNKNFNKLAPLTPLQAEIYQELKTKINAGYSKNLVHGVTGSGKTHIYIKLIGEVIASGKSVLFLLPEINLTPQFLEKFESHLQCAISVYSSELNASERYLLRQKLQTSDQPHVVIGVRSSIFLPFENLGLIIVDEEHDASFKQDDRCTYNARDIAIKKSSMLGIPTVLGSATPSIETYASAIKTKNYYPLRKRIEGSTLPRIILVDQREGYNKAGSDDSYWPLTAATIEAIYQAKQKGEQALVFINRLGFSSYVQCSACGHQFQCPNCSTNLRYFKTRQELSCQTCATKMAMPNICPKCSCISIIQKGYGTEKVEEVLKGALADIKVARFDRDEIKTMDQLKEVLGRFHAQEIDVLVGTQMLSKGHNFAKVNTVIILGIDQQLNFPDFRAMERAWQTLVQVSGRSGRFGEASRVYVQTHAPEHPLFAHVINHHFDEFYAQELELIKQ